MKYKISPKVALSDDVACGLTMIVLFSTGHWIGGIAAFIMLLLITYEKE